MAYKYSQKNPNSNDYQYHHYMHENVLLPILDRIISYNLNIEPLAGDRKSKYLMPFLFLTARGEAHYITKTYSFKKDPILEYNDLNGLAWAIAVINGIMDHDIDKVLDVVSARRVFREQAIYLLNNIDELRDTYYKSHCESNNVGDDWLEALQPGHFLAPYRDVLPCDWSYWYYPKNKLIQHLSNPDLTAEALAAVLCWLIATLGTDRLLSVGESMYCLYDLAVGSGHDFALVSNWEKEHFKGRDKVCSKTHAVKILRKCLEMKNNASVSGLTDEVDRVHITSNQPSFIN